VPPRHSFDIEMTNAAGVDVYTPMSAAPARLSYSGMCAAKALHQLAL